MDSTSFPESLDQKSLLGMSLPIKKNKTVKQTPEGLKGTMIKFNNKST